MDITSISHIDTLPRHLTQVKAGIWFCFGLFSFNICLVITNADHLETYWKQTKQGGPIFTKYSLPVNIGDILQPVKTNIYHHIPFPSICYRGHDRRLYKAIM